MNAAFQLDPAIAFEAITHFVFWCSIATLFLAAVERSVRKFYPDSKADKLIAFVTDLVSQFGALNFRDKIAPKGAWDGQDRRGNQEIK